jgi:REase_MTES_1575
MKNDKDTLNVLVAILPEIKDWKLLHDQLWYRIPVDKAPVIIRNGDAQYVAFYHTAKFPQELKWKVVKYAKIKSMTQVSRQELFPDEPPISTKAHKRYFKIVFDKLEELHQPIVSRRGHRFPFFATTEQKLLSGTSDLNRLFKGSPLEEAMATIIDAMEVEYEREWREYVNNDEKFYYLDFAIFCTKANINIECDGDEFHNSSEAVYKDKTRNNELESYKWKVLRYTTKHFLQNQQHIKSTLYKTIMECGGVRGVSEPETPYYPKKDSKGQLGLF